jgi:hypothetical protein
MSMRMRLTPTHGLNGSVYLFWVEKCTKSSFLISKEACILGRKRDKMHIIFSLSYNTFSHFHVCQLDQPRKIGEREKGRAAQMRPCMSTRSRRPSKLKESEVVEVEEHEQGCTHPVRVHRRTIVEEVE